jgi:NhaP-type Na+/H+ or K+/H+ antiporter
MSSSEFTSSLTLFVFLSLLLTILAYEVKKALKISVAPVLLVFGALFRDVDSFVHGFDELFEMVNNLDPHIISLAIMPALIFETAMSTDWFTFRRELLQIIPMATTVVALSSFLTAICLKFILNYDFSWDQAFLLGVLLNATDHVAVVAQLKDIYADEKFETLIGGETLLNEASVIVLFTLMMDYSSSSGSITSGFGLFLRLSIGGFALGLAFAFVMGQVMRRIVNDYIQETSLTFITAYLLYLTAETHQVHVSGALAVVTYGLYMSAYGKTLVSVVVEKPMHFFWNIIATDMEAIVFLLGGMLLGNLIIEAKDISIKDLGFLIVLFVLLHLVRFLVIAIHYPVLRYFGYGISWKEIVVLTFAGIKGVIALALSLIAYHDPNLPKTFSSLMIFFTIGIASLTISFDSIGIKLLIRYFELETLNEVQESMLVGVTTAILQHTAKSIERLRSDKEFDLVNWDLVIKMIGNKSLLSKVMKSNKIGKQVLKENPNLQPEDLLSVYSSKFEISKESLEIEMRSRFYSTLKAIYWHEFESGQCQGYTSLILIDSCNRAQLQENSKIQDWTILEKSLSNPKFTKFLERLSSLPLFGKLFRQMLYSRVMLMYDAASTFITAHEEALELLDNMEIDTDEAIFEEITEESHQQVALCNDYVKMFITDSYPEIISQVQSNMAAHTLLISQRKLINKIYSQGVIKEIEFECLLHAIDENIKSLKSSSSLAMASLKQVLRSRFQKASKADIEEILPHIVSRSFKPGMVLFHEGDPVDGAYLIYNGRVQETGKWIDQELIIGNIVGVQHLLPDFADVMTTTATALNLVQAAFIPRAVIKNKAFFEDLYKEASEEIILWNKDRLLLTDVKNEYIFRVIKSSCITLFQAGFTVNFRRGGILLYGKVKKHKPAVYFIKPSEKQVDVYEDCVILIFPQHLAGFYKQYKSLSEAFSKFYIRSAARNAKTRIFKDENPYLSMKKLKTRKM